MLYSLNFAQKNKNMLIAPKNDPTADEISNKIELSFCGISDLRRLARLPYAVMVGTSVECWTKLEPFLHKINRKMDSKD